MMKSKSIFLLVFLTAVIVRFIMNFSISLMPGLGGGYYLVQIREIIEEGHLAIRDMPLIFYLNAFIVKVLALMMPNQETNTLIIIVAKVLDSIGQPLLLYPLYKIQKDLIDQRFSNLFLIALAGFAVLSYSPLELCPDALKNSLALVFMTFFIYYYLKFLQFKSRKDLVLSLFILIITGITHFGTFMVSFCFLIVGLVIFYKNKAILPLIGLTAAGVILVAIFDSNRAMSMLLFWTKAFSIFISPRLAYYPAGIFNYISSFLLIWLLIRHLRKNKNELQSHRKNVLLLFLFFIIILSFPFYKFEFGRRLGFMLFIPQVIVLLFLYSDFKHRAGIIMSFSIIALLVFTVTMKLLSPKPLAITDDSYADMKRLNSEMVDPEKTIIFARHGLEWWLAWELRVHIAQPHIEVDEEMMEKYNQIFYLVQKKGENLMYPGKTSIFKKPVPPQNSLLVYDSEYFEMYELLRE